MNSLDEINTFLDDDFEERFNFDDIIINFTDECDAIEDYNTNLGNIIMVIMIMLIWVKSNRFLIMIKL